MTAPVTDELSELSTRLIAYYHEVVSIHANDPVLQAFPISKIANSPGLALCLREAGERRCAARG
jgi:hypothetical protein